MTPRARAARWRAIGWEFEVHPQRCISIAKTVLCEPGGLLADWMVRRISGEYTNELSPDESALLCYFLAASLEADDHA